MARSIPPGQLADYDQWLAEQKEILADYAKTYRELLAQGHSELDIVRNLGLAASAAEQDETAMLLAVAVRMLAEAQGPPLPDASPAAT
jgi:uncharacterized membrane protein